MSVHDIVLTHGLPNNINSIFVHIALMIYTFKFVMIEKKKHKTFSKSL